MTHPLLSRTLQTLLLGASLLAAAPASAQLLNFSQVPAGSTAREPAPNVIVSVDDSGSMGAAGIATLREALTTTFGIGSNLADDRIRLAWQSMNRCPTLGVNTANCGGFNGMRYLSGAHRNSFDAWARSLVQNGGTPGHLMMANAGDYLSTTGTFAAFANPSIDSPWAAVPGTTQAPVLSCRKSFHIFMTDGGWNSGTNNTNQHVDTAATNNGPRIVRGGNADGTTIAMPTGTPTYTFNDPQTRLYGDNWGTATFSTLSDLAFFYWSRDLQPGMVNNVRARMTQSATETFVATTGASTVLSPYWNPRNNPATWQNMVNYTIGFNTASTWVGSPTWGGNTFAGGLANLINGVNTWQTPFCGAGNAGAGNLPCDAGAGYGASGISPVVDGRRMDLWHSALNSRGLFVPAPNAQSLVDAFQTILDDILVQTSRPLVSIATNSSRVSTGSTVYVAGYNSAANWSGSLAAFGLNSSTSLPNASPTWQAEALLDARTNADMANRVVLTHNGAEGRGFNWANLSLSQQAAIQGTDSAATGTARIGYLRGDRTLETAAGGMRVRSSRLGDIVNSNIWFTGRPTRMTIDLPGHSGFRTDNAGRAPVLWVGGNDGMLHGFNATTGQEVLAYVPAGLYGTAGSSPLRSLTQTNYAHRYYVDGSPFTGDANLAQTGTANWRTLLVGTLGAGGKGYFVLDVTNPANFVNPGTAASNVVLLDRTATTDPDIGHIFAPPVVDELTLSRSEQIVRVNDAGTSSARWAVILGNGFNSTNQRPVLLVQYLDGARELRSIPVTGAGYAGQGNGLGAPRTVDLNGDGKVDMVYAGDLRGNLWKFDLTSRTPSDWSVSFSGNPLFTTSTPQPITTAPIWKVGPDGTGIQVLFGTGRNVTVADPGSTAVQTVYSLWDQSTFAASSASGSATVTVTDGTRIGTGTTSLIQQTQLSAAPGAQFFMTSTNGVPYDRANPTGPRGWYFNLPVSRERVISNPMVFEGPVVRINSVSPASSVEGETCDFSSTRGAGIVSFFNIYSGRPPSTNVFGQTEGNRGYFGTGETTSQRDPSTNKERLIDPSALCRGDDCPCVGDSCSECVGPTCSVCGGLKGAILELCGRGLGGSRSDWREMR